MKILVSVSAKKRKTLSLKEFSKLSLSQKHQYIKAFPNSSHAKLLQKKSSKVNANLKKETSEIRKVATKAAKKKTGSLVRKGKRKVKVAVGRKVQGAANTNAYTKSIFKDVGFKLNDITKAIRSPKEDILAALKDPTNEKLLKAAGGSFKGLGKAAMGVMQLPNSALGGVFKELHKSKAFQKLEKGTMKVDEFLKKYPMVKKIGGGLMAGAMIYQWMNMSFSGDFDDDFNVGHIGEALQGNYSVTDFVGSPSGAKAMAQLAAGIATGGLASFPWASGMNIAFAAIYTAARKSGDKDLMKKAQDAIKKAFNEKQPQKAKG